MGQNAANQNLASTGTGHCHLINRSRILSSETKSHGSFMKSTVKYANPYQATDKCAPRREGELDILVWELHTRVAMLPSGCECAGP
jgi:hypothetical protein